MKTPPRTPVFKKIKIESMKKHPRLAEINQAQPPMITPRGTGNEIEFSKDWGRMP